MSVEYFYKMGNKWFYETVRPSYKGLVDSYSSLSKVTYSGSSGGGSKYYVGFKPAYHVFIPYYKFLRKAYY